MIAQYCQQGLPLFLQSGAYTKFIKEAPEGWF